MLFSVLNFKDMLDIIEVINIEKKDQLNQFLSFFSTLECSRAGELYSLEAELQANRRILRFWLDALGLDGES